MKKILLPAILLCFAMVCLGYIHIDNMNKIKNDASQKQDKIIIDQ